MRQSIVEFNYIVYAEVQWKKKKKKALPFQLDKTLSLVKLLHIVQDSTMKNCIQCQQDSRSIFSVLLHKQYLNLHTELASLHN